nr:hypothetical protein [Tanacetum cinerariifolium]
MGEVHPAFFDDLAVLDHPRAPTATGRTSPGVFDETRTAVLAFQRLADTFLQVEQIGLHSL